MTGWPCPPWHLVASLPSTAVLPCSPLASGPHRSVDSGTSPEQHFSTGRKLYVTHCLMIFMLGENERTFPLPSSRAPEHQEGDKKIGSIS